MRLRSIFIFSFLLPVFVIPAVAQDVQPAVIPGPLGMCPDATDPAEQQLFKIIPLDPFPQRVERLGRLRLIGPNARLQASRFQPEDHLIPDAWKKLFEDQPRIQNRDGTDTFAACFTNVGSDRFNFLPSFPVLSLDQVPEGLTGVEIEPQTYYVVTYTGPASGIGDLRFTMTNQFWPNQTTYKRVDAPNLELYKPDYDPTSPNGTMDLWTPIEEPN